MASFKDIFTETNIGLFFLEKPMLQWEVQENCTDRHASPQRKVYSGCRAVDPGGQPRQNKGLTPGIVVIAFVRAGSQKH